MTLTTAAWIALVAGLGTTALGALRPRRARVPVRSARRPPDDEGWHPRVTSGCGR